MNPDLRLTYSSVTRGETEMEDELITDPRWAVKISYTKVGSAQLEHPKAVDLGQRHLFLYPTKIRRPR